MNDSGSRPGSTGKLKWLFDARRHVPRRRGLSVRGRLALLVVGSALLILGATGLIAYRLAEETAVREVRSRAVELARSTSVDINARLARLARSAQGAAALDLTLNQAGERNLDSLRAALRHIGEQELDFLSIYVFYDRQVIPNRDYAVVWETRDEAKGNVTTEPYVPNLPGEPTFDPSAPVYDYFQQNPRFAAARDAGRFVWTDVFRDVGGRPGNVFVMAGVAPIYDAQDRFVGIAGVDVQFGQIRTYMAGVKPTTNAYALLLDRDGTLISHARDTLIGVIERPVVDVAREVNSESLLRLSQEMVAGRTGIVEMTDPLTGEEVFAAYAPVEQIGWSVGLMIPRADLLGRVNDLRNVLLGVILIALVALGGIGLLLGETTVRPLIRLTQTASEVAAGDLRRMAAVERDDEIGLLAATFNTMTARLRDLIGSLEARVEARTAQLKASADVGRAAASILDPEHLLREVVNLITDRFGFYYAAVFMLDETGHYAVLREATGEAGRALKERGHTLEAGGQSMVGAAITLRQARIALDVGAEAVRFANPLLPETRSEIALPLIVGDRVLGALDVQSTQEAAFDEASVAVLQSMTDQVAVALSNAQSFDAVQSALRATSRLYELSRALFAAASPRDAYAALVHSSARLPEFDRVTLMMVHERDVDGRPTRYELAGEWDVVKGTRIATGETFVPDEAPVAALADAESIVVVREVDDPRVPALTRQVMAQAGLKVAVIVPLLIRAQYEGLLVSAARWPAAVSDADVRYLQSAAEQLAVSLSALRSNEETRAALERVDLLNRRLSGEAWRAYLSARRSVTAESGRGGDGSDGNRLSAPIVVRGETLGALELEDADPQRQWTDEDWSLLTAVLNEVALAVENARLIEQTQQRAAREAELNRIAERIRRAGDIDSILRVTAEELGRTLDTSHANVRLGSPHAVAGHRDGR